MNNSKRILGVDVGGVILDFAPYIDTDLAFAGENYLKTPSIEDAIDSLKTLNKSMFAGNIFLVSKHGGDGPERILEWLDGQDFFKKTEIPKSNFHPCGKRNEKADIVKNLGITHFVDDRAEVLNYMIGVVPNLYLFQSLDENREDHTEIDGDLVFVENWKELMSILLNV